MKRIFSLVLALLLTGSLLSGCGKAGGASSAQSGDGRLRVISANFPGYDFARAVCGDDADVSMLLPPGAESHSYEPTPRDLLDLQNCDLFIYVGGEGDTWVDTILDSLDSSVKTLRMIDCVDLLEEETIEGMTAGEEPEEGESVEMDEHVWTSPVNAGKIVAAAAQEMEALDPDHAADYAANAQAYEDEIARLDSDFRDFFAGISNPTMIFGDRFPLRYFAEEYGIRCYAAFPGCSTQTEPSAATIAFLTDKVKSAHIGTVYYIEFSNHLVADSIAEAAGAGTALFQTCHNVSQAQMDAGDTYVSIMRENLDTLKATMH